MKRALKWNGNYPCFPQNKTYQETSFIIVLEETPENHVRTCLLDRPYFGGNTVLKLDGAVTDKDFEKVSVASNDDVLGSKYDASFSASMMHLFFMVYINWLVSSSALQAPFYNFYKVGT